MFERGRELGIPHTRWRMGAFYMGGKYKEPATHIINLIEKTMPDKPTGHFGKESIRKIIFNMLLSRYYPMVTNGKSLGYYNDYQKNRFTYQWVEMDKRRLHVFIFLIYRYWGYEKIVLNPSSSYSIIPIGKSNAGYMEIQPAGGERQLILPVAE